MPAAGDRNGQIVVLTLPGGEEAATLSADRNQVHCLALHRGLHHRDQGEQKSTALENWLLAAGDDGGLVTIWDLQTPIVKNYCRELHYVVDELAFSPEGMTLASADRLHVRLWDTATGRPLLDLDLSARENDLAFSSDGS